MDDGVLPPAAFAPPLIDSPHDQGPLSVPSLSDHSAPPSPRQQLTEDKWLQLPDVEWNLNFHQLLELQTDDEAARTFQARQLQRLQRDFALTARDLARQLVDEYAIAMNAKLIKPLVHHSTAGLRRLYVMYS